jgi:glycosyltransferase involved in cell wall biosynthesis
MNTVGVYRSVFPCLSEAFILEQVTQMRRYRPTFVVGRQVEPVSFPVVRLWDAAEPSTTEERLHRLTRSPHPYLRRGNLPTLGLLHAHFGPDGVYALPLAEALGIPLVVTYHGYETVASSLTLLLSRDVANYQFLFHEAALKQRTRAILAVCDFIRERLIRKGYPPQKVIRHYIGVDTEKFRPVPSLGDGRYVLSVARHVPYKGIQTLLRAFARLARRHPDVRIVQVGTGPYTPALTRLAERLAIAKQVHFLGAQSHAQVQRWMEEAEVFVLASETSRGGVTEGLPIVIQEAMACAVPVIATRHAGIPEAVAEGETGFLVGEREVEALAERLDVLLCDGALRRRMGRRGRERVCDCFDIRRQTAQLETLYDRFAASSRPVSCA